MTADTVADTATEIALDVTNTTADLRDHPRPGTGSCSSLAASAAKLVSTGPTALPICSMVLFKPSSMPRDR